MARTKKEQAAAPETRSEMEMIKELQDELRYLREQRSAKSADPEQVAKQQGLVAKNTRRAWDSEALVQFNVAQVQVLTAFPLDAATESRIASAMQTRLGKAVRISQTIDSSLIGGAKVKVGDMVFDASLQGGLSQLANVFNIK